MMKAILFMAALASASCLRTTSYKCDSDTKCGAGGVCEYPGYCSYADPDCPEGRRYGEYSGIYSNKCIGEIIAGDDSGVDSPPGDGPMTDVPLGNCPASYNLTHGTRRYRVIAAADWFAQVAACDAGTNRYLAIPNDQAELTAIVAFANATIWVGVSDEGVNQSSADDEVMEDVNGAAFATGTAIWGANQPDDTQTGAGGGGANNAECVAAETAMSGKLMDDRCALTYAAVCECEP